MVLRGTLDSKQHKTPDSVPVSKTKGLRRIKQGTGRCSSVLRPCVQFLGPSTDQKRKRNAQQLSSYNRSEEMNKYLCSNSLEKQSYTYMER